MKNRSKSRKRQRNAVPHKRALSAALRYRLPARARKAYSKSNKSRLAPFSKRSMRSVSPRDRSFHALADARRGVPLRQAIRDNGVALRTFKKYLGSEILQDRPGGRIRVTEDDRRVRYLQIPGLHGPIDIDARGFREASRAARYKAAVNRFLAGDTRALAPWRGKKIAGVKLVTDARTLKDQAQKDELPYSLYRSLSGGAA